MAKKPSDANVIKSLEDLHRRLPELVRLQETHPRLAVAALANPLLALEQAGYAIAPAIAREVELRTRFRGDEADTLIAQEGRLKAALGTQVDLDDPRSFAAPMLRTIAAGIPKAKRAAKQQDYRSGEDGDDDLRGALETPLQPHRPGTIRPADPLAAYSARHPLIADFVEYRRLESSRPRLADRTVFEGLLSGRTESPIGKARFSYKSAPKRTVTKPTAKRKGG